MKYIEKYQFLIGMIIVVLAGLFVALPLFNSGWFPMHDDAQIARVIQMEKGLQAGHIPVRWAPDLGYGYGYPIFNFYAPLPYYIGAIVSIMGAAPILATKIMIALGLLFSGISMYVLGKKLWGVWGGVLSSMLYLYAPYHASDVYVRGAIGEIYALVFIPLVVYGIIRVLTDKTLNKWSVVLLSTSYACLILSHNISAFVTTLLMGVALISILILHLAKNKSLPIKGKLVPLFGALAIGIGLSAFFWLPALLEQEFTNVEKVIGANSRYEQHFLFIDQLWDSPWGYAGSTQGREDGMSFKIGKLHIAIGLLGIGVLLFQWWRKKLNSLNKVVLISLIGILSISLFMTLPLSKGVWDLSPYLAFIQFPWRFLIWIIFSISLLGGAVVLPLSKRTALVLVLLMSFGVVVINAKYFKPEAYFDLSESEYTSPIYTRWYVSKQSDEYMPRYFPIPSSEDEVVYERFESKPIVNMIEKGDDYSYFLTFSSEEDTNIIVNIATYPVWEFKLNDAYITPEIQNGVYVVPIKAGRDQQLFIRYVSTTQAFIANMITIVSLAILFGTMMGIPKYIWQPKKQSK